jgi:6-phosphogluconolactonase
MSGSEVIVHRDARLLADAIAARLITRIVDLQAAGGPASIVLTGGGIGTATLAALRAAPACGAIDWTRTDVWWGDERFLAAGDPERNETGARDALLDHVPVPASQIHAMPALDGPCGPDPEAAAEVYAAELAGRMRPGDHNGVPSFDILMLGIGPDAHVASLFPEQPALYEQTRSVVAVRGAPKPPPVRLTLTMPSIRAATEVWILAAGGEKARAVHLALSRDAGVIQVPAAGSRGRSRTLFLLDEAAAASLPRQMGRAASP